MFQEEIADITASHLREHLEAYLEFVQSIYDDGVKLQFPKAIETNNLVGGVYSTKIDSMPAYAVDIIDKQFNQVTPDGLWLYNYEGHLAGVVTATSEVSANKIVKRHEQATEMFVKAHEFMHQQENLLAGNDFRIVGMGFVSAAFSGAEMVDEENDRQAWIAGFRIDLLWQVSESGPTQHA